MGGCRGSTGGGRDDGWMKEGEDGGEDRGVDGWMSRYITYCQRICFSLQFACYG